MSKPAKSWSVQDARAHFGDVIEAALNGKPQRITRRGKRAVVVVAEESWTGAAKPSSEMNLGEFLATFPLTAEEWAEARPSRPRGKDNLTIGNIGEGVSRRLSLLADRNRRSIEDEARRVLSAGLATLEVQDNVADAIAAIVDPIGGIELELPPRMPSRPPIFDD